MVASSSWYHYADHNSESEAIDEWESHADHCVVAAGGSWDEFTCVTCGIKSITGEGLRVVGGLPVGSHRASLSAMKHRGQKGVDLFSSRFGGRRG